MTYITSSNSLTPAGLLCAVATDYLADSRLKEAPLLAILAQNAESQQQIPITWGAKVANASVSGRQVTDNLATDTPGQTVPATINIPYYYIKHQFSVVRADLVNALTDGMITAVKNPVRTAVTDAIDSITRKIQTLIYTGTGAGNTTQCGVYGLSYIIGQNNVYAGIDRSVYSRWNSIVTTGVVPGTPEAFTLNKLSNIKIARRTAGASSRPNPGHKLIIVTNPTIEEEVIRPLYSQTFNEMAQAEALAKDILPYTTYYVSGIPVVSDVDSPLNTVYLLNPSKLTIKTYDDSPEQLNNPRVSYVNLPVIDGDGNVTQSDSIKIRMADVSQYHPDIAQMELSIRFQLVAYDPVDSVSAILDVNQFL